MQNESQEKISLFLHKAKIGYVGEICVPLNYFQTEKTKNTELIMIVDRSGSMGNSYTEIFKNITPLFLEKIKYPEEKQVHFITFDDRIESRKITKAEFLNPKVNENARGCTYMSGVFSELEKIIVNQNSSYRILTLSDGILHDSSQTSKKASEFYTKIKEKFNINSQAVRFFSSRSANPDTLGLASVLQFNSVKQAELIDIDAKLDKDAIATQLSQLFIKDGLGIKVTLCDSKASLRSCPWEERAEEILLTPGKNVFWTDRVGDFKLKIEGKIIGNLEIEESEEINNQNYGLILADKIKVFMTKLKILKILQNENSQNEINKIIKCFKEFEESLNDLNEEEIVLKDGKMSSRIQYIKKLITKKKGLISNQMEAIQNEDKLNQLNNQQKAEYLRNVDNTKLGKSLAKRAFNSGLDFTERIKGEIIEMKNHISELNQIDFSNDPISFYSTSSTVESLKELCDLVEDPIFNEMVETQFLELVNIVGIATYGNISDYPDPLLYLPKEMYPGCYISVSDIILAESVSKGKNLEAPGIKKEINNCIPVFTDKKVYDFFRSHAPTLLELSAGIGMRRVLAEIPNTFISSVLSGVWKMLSLVKANEKFEVNIMSLLEMIKTMENVAGNFSWDVFDTIQNQFKDKTNEKLGLYIKGYGLLELLPVLNKIAAQSMLSPKELQKFLRALYRFEVYKIIRKNIRKSENQKNYIDKTLILALGIDFEKYGTKLPAMFEKEITPEFCSDFVINKEAVSEFRKQMGWIDSISYSYLLLEAAHNADYINSIKNLPKFTEELKKSSFGITYDYDKFLIFNIVQSLVFREKIEREKENEGKMKIIDSNDEKEVDKFLREQTKHIYAAKYSAENQKQIKEQNEIITKELLDILISAQNINDFNELMRKGITKGYLTHIIKDESTKGYNDLKTVLLDDKRDVPLRYEKIRSILTSVDEKGEKIWNNGNAIRNKRYQYKKFIERTKPEFWEEICKLNIEHKYREKENRHGHSNSKMSYWAKGYETMNEFYDKNEKEIVEKYKKEHTNCCGFGGKNSKYELRKQERKMKRKKYRKDKR